MSFWWLNDAWNSFLSWTPLGQLTTLPDPLVTLPCFPPLDASTLSIVVTGLVILFFQMLASMKHRPWVCICCYLCLVFFTWSSLNVQTLMDRRIRPWVNKKIVEYIGEDEPTLSDFICKKVISHSSPSNILADISMVSIIISLVTGMT